MSYLRAFSMMELVVVLAVMSILTLIAVPNYQHIIGRFQYMEVLHESAPWRIQTEMCYWHHGSFDMCSSGEPGMRSFYQGQSISALDIENGEITITPQHRRSLSESDILVMTPEVHEGVLRWHYSGPAVESGYVQKN